MEMSIATLNHRVANGQQFSNTRSARAAFLRAVAEVHGINLTQGASFQYGGFHGAVGVTREGDLWACASHEQGLVQEVRKFSDMRTARKWLVSVACRPLDLERMATAGHVTRLATDALQPYRSVPGVANAGRRRHPRPRFDAPATLHAGA